MLIEIIEHPHPIRIGTINPNQYCLVSSLIWLLMKIDTVITNRIIRSVQGALIRLRKQIILLKYNHVKVKLYLFEGYRSPSVCFEPLQGEFTSTGAVDNSQFGFLTVIPV